MFTVSLLDLSWVCVFIATQIVHRSEHVCATSAEFGITNKFQPVGKLTNRQFVNNQDFLYFCLFSVGGFLKYPDKMYKTGKKIKWKWHTNNVFLNQCCALKSPGHNIFQHQTFLNRLGIYLPCIYHITGFMAKFLH